MSLSTLTSVTATRSIIVRHAHREQPLLHLLPYLPLARLLHLLEGHRRVRGIW